MVSLPVAFLRGFPRQPTDDSPMKTRKKAKLALKAGVSSPAGFPGFPLYVAATSGSVTYAPYALNEGTRVPPKAPQNAPVP